MADHNFVVVVLNTNPMFLNRRAAARYRDQASIISGRESFSWNW
jgi:hypothetical protein